jgi:hypothetical protein
MTDKPHNSEKWTVARFRSFIKGGLRQISYRWPPKHEVKKAAWVKRGLYKCEGYKRKWHTAPTSILEKGKRVNNVFVDHIHPVIDPKKGWKSWDETIKRMFCEVEGLQVLCKECHKEKTNDERKQRSS